MACFDVTIPARVRLGLPNAIRALAGPRHRSKIEEREWRQELLSHLAMTRELLACLRIVPLWTHGAHPRSLRVLPPVAAEPPRPAPLRETVSSVPEPAP